MKFTKPIKTYYYEKDKKPIPLKIIIYLISFSYIAAAVLVGFIIYNAVKKNFNLVCILLAIFIFYVLILVIYDKTHTWETGKCIYFYPKKVVYRYDGLISMMGKTENRCIIKEISDIQVSKKKITIFGYITVEEPLQQPKNKTKIDIPSGIENQDKCIKEMKEWLKHD